MERWNHLNYEFQGMEKAWKSLEGKWKLPALFVLSKEGTIRYSEFKKYLKITNVMLSNTLKELESQGLVHRKQYNEIPPRVEYSLTNLSLELIPALEQIAMWGSQLKEEQSSDLIK